MRISRTAVVAFTCLLGTGALLAGGPSLVPAARAEEPTFRVAVEEATPLATVLTTLVEKAGLPLLWSPQDRAIEGKQMRGGVVFEGTRDQVLQRVRSLLVCWDLVLIPVGPTDAPTYYVTDARQAAAILKLKPEPIVVTDENVGHYEGMDGLFVSATIRVRHLSNLRDARNALNRMVTGQNIGNVTEVPEARAFVVTDFAPSVAAIYRMVREMDVPAEPPAAATFEAVALKHVPAAAAARVLVAHFLPEAPAPRTAAARGDPAAAPVPAPAPPPALRITPDDRTNQVLVTGTPADVEAVKRAIAAIDVEVATAPRPTVMLLRLQHVQATDAAMALSNLAAALAGVWTQDVAGWGPRPTIVAWPQGNALLVGASAAALDVIRALVAELDRP